MKRFARFLTASLLILSAGCPRDVYEVDVRPRGDKVQREVTFYVEDEGRPVDRPEQQREALDRLAKVYGVELPRRGQKGWTFRKDFTREMPQDIGGAGRYVVMECPLGSATVYAERFRGDIDLVGSVERRLKAADLTVDIIAGWLATRHDKEADWPKVRKLVDTEIRAELKNLVLYFWLLLNEGRNSFTGPEAGEELPMRMTAYLVEKKYLTPEQALHAGSGAQPEFLRIALGNRFAGLKADAVIDDMAGLFGDGDRAKQLQAELQRYLAERDDYARLRTLATAWKKSLSADGKVPPEQVLGAIAEGMVSSFDPAGMNPRLKLTVHAAAEPFWTNMTWDDKTKTLSCERPITAEGILPTFAYAVWSVPDEAQQENFFGKVVLDGQTLAEYAAWYAQLTRPRRQTVDRLLADYKQNKNPRILNRFRFAEAPDAKEPPSGLKLLHDALTEK